MRTCHQMFIATFILLSLPACSNYLYRGEMEVLNSAAEKSKAMLYWTKTSRPFAEVKAGPAILMTECSTRRLTFVEAESGIVFYGTPGEDALADHAAMMTQDTVCGRIENADRFENLQAGPVKVAIRCKAVRAGDAFTINTGAFTPNYIQAREQPYIFEIQQSSSWNLLGAVPEVPLPPDCRE